MKHSKVKKWIITISILGLFLIFPQFILAQEDAAEDIANEVAEQVVDELANEAADAAMDAALGEGGEMLADAASDWWGIGLGIGSVNIAGEQWMQIALQPEFSIIDDMLGIGLNLSLEFNVEGEIREEAWNSWKAIANVIAYLRWGHKGQAPVYARIGNLSAYTLGHGTLMHRFTNDIFYPAVRKLGLAFDLDLEYAGIETMMNDMTIPGVGFTIAAARVYVRPISWFGMELPFNIHKLHIGISYIIDRRPFEVDYTAENENGDMEIMHGSLFDDLVSFYGDYDLSGIDQQNFMAYGFDAGLPLFNNFAISLNVYMDINFLVDYNWGFHWGFYGSINPGLLDVAYKFEFRHFKPGYLPRYFGSQYEANHATKIVQLYAEYIEGGDINTGWLFSLGKSFLDGVIGFDLTIEGIWPSQEGLGPELTARAWFRNPEFLPGLAINLEYNKIDIASWRDTWRVEDVDTLMTASIGYMINDNVEVVVTYLKTFAYELTDTNDDGIEDTNQLVGQQDIQLETNLHF